MKQVLEVRLTAGADLRVQPAARKNRSGPTLKGYAVVFNSFSHDMGGFLERVLPGAFRDTLKQRDVLFLYAHDHSALLGRTSTGSLELREDARGLFFQMHLPDTQLARDLAELVSVGDLNKMSFGFVAREDVWSLEGTKTLRTLRKVDLFEISIVPEPAYEQTSVALRVVLDAVLSAELAARRRRLDELVL